MVSGAQKIQSNEAQGEQSTDSVYDFLYHDARRVASFISQFDKYGHLTGLSRGEHAERSRSRTGKLEASGGMPGVIGGSGSHEDEAGASSSRELSRTYDPLWTNALTLLDYLDERSLIQRDLSTATLGQFVLASGSLDVRDLRLIQQAMALPSMKAQIAAAATPAHTQSFHKSKSRGRTPPAPNAGVDSGAQFGTEFVALLPHSVQARLHNSSGKVWCSLNEDGLVVSSSDLFLKHGVRIAGVWHMLGVLDAIPTATGDEKPEDIFAEAQDAMPSDEFDSTVTIATQGMAGLIDGIVPFARLLLGRRDSEYGFTPLLIFRQTTG